MFSTTIKRSVATLGVVAGLLAAAVPASAQIAPGTIGFTTPVGSNKGNLATDPSSEVDNQMKGISGTEGMDAVTAAASSNQVFTSVSNVFKGEMIGLEPDYALGTQVGSEGVKTPIDDMDLSIGGPNASTSGRPQGVIWDLLEQANAGTQVGSEGVKAPTRADDQVKVSGYTFNPKEIAID